MIKQLLNLFKSSDEKVMYIYPKDKFGKPSGHTICVIVKNDRIYTGEALCHSNDQFNKKEGRRLSYFRASAFINRKYR
jgi:hypothetical protein